MNINIGSVFNLSMNRIPQKDIHRFRFKIMPFIIRELKIGSLFHLTSGITYIKILTEHLPDIIPKIEVDIKKSSFSELLADELSNLDEFFPDVKRQKRDNYEDNSEYFIATRGKELVFYTTVAYVRGGRLMLCGTKTLESFRGKFIYSAVLSYLMKYYRNVKGKDRIYISTNGTNIKMHKNILRKGFKIDIISYDFSLFKGRIKPIQFLRNLRNR